MVAAAIPSDSIFATYKQPKNILSLLVHSKFNSSPGNIENFNVGCKKCKNANCFLCKYYLIETDTFKSFHCDTVFKINQELTCETMGIIYLLIDNICQRCYTGRTIGCMKPRMSNYKSHIKTNHKDCEMAQHFSDVSSDTHPLYSSGDASVRTKEFQDNFDSHLSKQIKVIIIEKVDLSSAETAKEIRDVIEAREGYWQTQLRNII